MALKYELGVLEKFIDETLHPKNFQYEQTFFETRIPEAMRFLAKEKERITGQLVTTIYNSKDRQRDIFIHHHQKSLIQIADKVYHYLLPKDPQSIYSFSPVEDIVNLYKEAFRCIEDLLHFIEQNFREYFNPDEKVTDVYLHITQDSLKSNWKILRQRFRKLGVDEELVTVIMRPVIAFCKKEKASYRQLIYIKSLTYHLNTELSFSEEKNVEQKLLKLLVYLNFNNGEYASYCLSKIVDVINALPEQKDKIEKLLHYRKEYNQLQLKPGVSLKPALITIKEQVCSWINEEIHYLETKFRLLSVAPVLKDSPLPTDEERLHFSVSVHVLGILARAAHDSKLVMNPHGSVVYRALSKHSSSLQSKKPSAKSLEKKSYEAERAHKEKAILVLQEMIKWVQGY